MKRKINYEIKKQNKNTKDYDLVEWNFPSSNAQLYLSSFIITHMQTIIVY